jgi:hypothetical protein
LQISLVKIQYYHAIVVGALVLFLLLSPWGLIGSLVVRPHDHQIRGLIITCPVILDFGDAKGEMVGVLRLDERGYPSVQWESSGWRSILSPLTLWPGTYAIPPLRILALIGLWFFLRHWRRQIRGEQRVVGER